MKSVKFILPLLLVLAPFLASAQSVPVFPMSLWGNVTINGVAAPVGTIVRARYGTTLAGEVVVQDAGVYGYTEPTKQKLVVGEGSGVITLSIQSPSFNGNVETTGTPVVTIPQFSSASTTKIDLAFTIPTAVTPTPTPTSGGGGSGSPSSGTSNSTSGNSSGGSGGGGIAGQSSAGSSGSGGGGVVGPISSSTQTSTQSGATPTPQSVSPTNHSFVFTQSLAMGASGADVTQLQTVLIKAGLLHITSPTGYFGPLTQTALKAYQTAHGLSASGSVDAKTLALLNQGAAIDITTQTPIATSSNQFTRNLSVGMSGADVSTLQNLMTKSAVYAGPITGYFGPLTRKAVIAYQAKYNILQTGFVGPLTRAQLNK